MKLAKRVFSNVDIHLNTSKKTLVVVYGETRISLCISSEGRVRLETKLVLDKSAICTAITGME